MTGVVAFAALASLIDLHRVETGTLVIYTTPALRDVLEDSILPAFEARTGRAVLPVYLAAGEEYYRVQLSPDRPEADLFLHASPMFIEKGHAAGYLEVFNHTHESDLPGDRSRTEGAGHFWYAFAWSPLVEVYHPRLGAPPDLANAEVRYGLPHPVLSNNGVYVALFFEETDPAAGQRAIGRAIVQTVNARTNIAAIAGGSFDLTLGYEAVVRFFQAQGAKVAQAVPIIDGRTVTTPVVFSVGLVDGHPHAGAEVFIDHLFSRPVQDRLGEYYLRPVRPGSPDPPHALDLSASEWIEYDWSQWKTLEASLGLYEVN